MFGITRGRLIGSVALVAALGVALGLTLADDDAAAPADEITVQVGTYQAQAVFEQYYQTQELFEFVNELQAEAEVAQREGNQQKMMEIQMRFQQREQQVMDAFMNDVEQAVSEVAQDANIDLIALEIQYAAPHISEPRDLTQQIITKVNENAPQAADDGEDE